MLSCLLLVGIPARRRCWRTLLGLMVLLVFLGFATTACGGGGSASSGGGGGIAGTTPGAYTVTVTAASPGIAAVTTTVSLTVP